MRKTLSFAILHFGVAFTITYWLTGSLMTGGLVAMVEPMINTLAFYVHEKCWHYLARRRATGLAKPAVPASSSGEFFAPARP